MSVDLVTLPELMTIFPLSQSPIMPQFVIPLNKTMAKYDITTRNRRAMFLAQVGEESEQFRLIEEMLNYSAEGLLATFPTHFNDDSAKLYAHDAISIANIVYSNRMGNGNIASGDGFKFRGRGLIQITGRHNYSLVAKDFAMGLDDVIKYMETVEGATISAGWFWNIEKANHLADQEDIKAVTKAINGGYNGLENRVRFYQKAKTTLV